jgi:hypothetical protein
MLLHVAIRSADPIIRLHLSVGTFNTCTAPTGMLEMTTGCSKIITFRLQFTYCDLNYANTQRCICCCLQISPSQACHVLQLLGKIFTITVPHNIYHYCPTKYLPLLSHTIFTITVPHNIYHYCPTQYLTLLFHTIFTITVPHNIYHYCTTQYLPLLSHTIFTITVPYNIYHYCPTQHLTLLSHTTFTITVPHNI